MIGAGVFCAGMKSRCRLCNLSSRGGYVGSVTMEYKDALKTNAKHAKIAGCRKVVTGVEKMRSVARYQVGSASINTLGC
jgi:hypothetical protein